MTEYFDVGKIANTHGLKGELKIIPTTDFVDERFVPGQKLFIKHANEYVVVTINTVRSQKNFLLVTLKEFNDINEVEQFKGDLLFVAAADLHDLDDNSFYYHEIIGLPVFDEATGEKYGVVKEILTPGANDVWVIDEGNNKTFLLPFIKQVVKNVDVANSRIEVELMEGLRDEN